MKMVVTPLMIAARNIDIALWKKYRGESDNNPPKPWQALTWLETDLVDLLMGDKDLTIDKMKEEIMSFPRGAEVTSNLNFQKIEHECEVRNDWATALRSVRKGSDLSSAVSYGLSKKDIFELAKLHKAKKFRKKIEDLLEDCNFHTECGDFADGKYDEYLNIT